MYFQLIVSVVISVFHGRSAWALPFALREPVEDMTLLVPTQAQIVYGLGPMLSRQASIYFPGSSDFATATERWNVHAAVDIRVVVEPGSDDDVAATIIFANRIGLPFLAVNTAHGSTDTLSRIQNGIEIYVHSLNSISISPDGNSASIGGGVYTDILLEFLEKHGKIAASGACGCVGMMGAGLGGGHGRVQGLYGLILDNMIDANLVLADGSQILVSEESHADLWWGLRGAGQNFGIVTRFTYKIYDMPSPEHYYAQLFFTQDKLEQIFTRLNVLTEATLPKEIGAIYVNYAWVLPISTAEPVLIVTVDYTGNKIQAAPYVAPFSDLEPTMFLEGSVPYSELAAATGVGSNDSVCDHGLNRMQFAQVIQTYNVTAVRIFYDIFKQKTLETPAYNESIAIFESYALQGVRAVDPASTAYPHREEEIILTLVITYKSDISLDARAIAWGEQTRQLILESETPSLPLRVYVNYAFGNEPLESMYGYEPWRLERLRALKKKYDPKNRFAYYLPVVP